MNKLEQLQQIIDTALQGPGKSKLTNEVIDGVGGFISPNNRHLLNNLGAISTNYCDLGSHVGASLVSTVYGNDNLENAIPIDDFSLFSNEQQDSHKEFLKNCEKIISGKYRLINKDCWTVTKEDINCEIDLLLVDAAHDYESQRRAITHFAPMLAKEAIIVVDDAAWPEVNAGTMKGLVQSGLNIDYLVYLDSGVRSDTGDRGFWNGILCVLVSK